jgi:hypothetical protein
LATACQSAFKYCRPNDSQAYDVFLSYSRADSAAAETLRARLKEAGLSAFLDRYGLLAGQQWQPWLEEHLLSCRALIVLVGPLGFAARGDSKIQRRPLSGSAKTRKRF